AVVLAAFISLMCAGLWAQLVEGSAVLSRPFGFYGGICGIAIGGLVAPVVGTSPWLVLAAWSVAAPWVQAVGRIRCLVQGCCHGAPAPAWLGIRHHHSRSRVVRLTDFAGAPLHPTPLYSILWNALTALAVARLWTLHAAVSLIAGVYLILNGLGRFVEEAYRGEPQTPIIARLRLYQWLAIATVILGALCTALGPRTPAPDAVPSSHADAAALLFALVAGLALGVDFPQSERRFSRLA
ncbi:MAG TPA: prolipoprotein diacylglyceryl transferase family protein, partial [Myxococcaceae bacterium]|nr:prolipoprotein diacylglyceryl transferase family protein [Myxococcaceae bacterium]